MIVREIEISDAEKLVKLIQQLKELQNICFGKQKNTSD
jgi:hypothetical protein